MTMQRTFNIYFVDTDGTNNATTAPDKWVDKLGMPLAEYLASDIPNHVGIRFYSTRIKALEAATQFLHNGTIIDEPGTEQHTTAKAPQTAHKAVPNDSKYKWLLGNLENLQKRLLGDSAGYASTMLNRMRNTLNDYCAIRWFLFTSGELDLNESDILEDIARDIRATIRERMQERIRWQAKHIDETIEHRKKAGTYKGEFTTAVILANAYNDIFDEHDFEG